MNVTIGINADTHVVRSLSEGVEVLGHFGDPPMFAVVTTPASPERGLVVCSPVHAEFRRNYRREIRLAHALAEAGIATIRFHYMGTGDSDGDAQSLSLKTMLADTSRAFDFLRHRAGVTDVDVLGTRLGGFVAAQLAARIGGRLVIWEPVTDARRYFGEVFRAKRLAGVVVDGAGSTSAEMLAELESTGSLDINGYEVGRRLYRSAIAATYPGTGVPAGLLVPASRATEIRPEVRDLADHLSGGTGAFDVARSDPGPGWWIDNERATARDRIAADQALVDLTAGFLTAAVRR